MAFANSLTSRRCGSGKQPFKNTMQLGLLSYKVTVDALVDGWINNQTRRAIGSDKYADTIRPDMNVRNI